MVSSLEYVEKVSFLGRRGSHHHGHLVHVSDGNLKGKMDRFYQREGDRKKKGKKKKKKRKNYLKSSCILPRGRGGPFYLREEAHILLKQ